jgi:phosphatidate phosphatase APP1
MRKIALGGAIACLSAAAAFAQDGPQSQMQGNVRYVTGGIGIDESTALKGMESQYSLTITFAEQRDGKAEYLANVPVTITDSHNATVFSLSNDGPYLLVKLPAGSYQVSASHNGQSKSKSVSVGNGHNADHVTFDW